MASLARLEQASNEFRRAMDRLAHEWYLKMQGPRPAYAGYSDEFDTDAFYFSRRNNSGNGGRAGNNSKKSRQRSPSDDGLEREARTRALLESQGYIPLGENDKAIRRILNIPSDQPSADYVYQMPNGKWFIAESKGSDIEHAIEQLQSTTDALNKYDVDSIGNIEYQIFTHQAQFNRLSTSNSGGYRIDNNGFLFYSDGINFDPVCVKDFETTC